MQIKIRRQEKFSTCHGEWYGGVEWRDSEVKRMGKVACRDLMNLLQMNDQMEEHWVWHYMFQLLQLDTVDCVFWLDEKYY